MHVQVMQVVDEAPVLGMVLLWVDHCGGGTHGQGGTDRAHGETWKRELAVDGEISDMNVFSMTMYHSK